MARRMSKPDRVDTDWSKELEEIKRYRAMNGDNYRELSTRELTRMMKNAVSWKSLKEELKNKPRRK